jgi:hypothetical protein
MPLPRKARLQSIPTTTAATTGPGESQLREEWKLR